jgi:hypothetical protein
MGTGVEVRRGSMYNVGGSVSGGKGLPSRSMPDGGQTMACTWRGKPHGLAERPSRRTT